MDRGQFVCDVNNPVDRMSQIQNVWVKLSKFKPQSQQMAMGRFSFHRKVIGTFADFKVGQIRD